MTMTNRPGARRQPRRSGRGVFLLVIGLIMVMAAIMATVVSAIYHSQQQVPQIQLPVEGCMVSVDGFSTWLSWEQAENAAIIVGESINRGLPARAATIALVTAYQESDLRNVDYGDLDSLGLFQQRPSQGWGTPEQVMDPWYAAGAFYDHLVQVPGWDSGVINDVAQEVQRSGYPEAYGQHEQKGRAWASALTGYSPAAVSCVDRSGASGNATVLTDFFARVWGDGVTVSVEEGVVRAEGTSTETNWALGHLSMLWARSAGITAVQVEAQSWTMSGLDYALWQPAEAQASQVGITLHP